jgi:hypothetical protein
MKRLRDILEKNETVIYKTPERAAPAPKNWVQSMFKITAGEPAPEPVKPLPQFDKTQSAMPDMDTMVAKEKQPVKISDAGIKKTTTAFTPTIKPEPKVASLVAPQSGYPAAEKPKAPIPKPKPELDVKVIGKGDTLWRISGGDPDKVKKLKKLNPNLDPNKMPIGYKLKLK